MNLYSVWTRWFLLWSDTSRPGDQQPDRPLTRTHRRTACPHCTNLDTLTAHCTGDRCGWSWCTCGAVVYGGRRHRHPRHGSGADTCHDPAAAA